VEAEGTGVGEPKMAIKAATAAIMFGPYVVIHWRSAVQLMAVAPMAWVSNVKFPAATPEPSRLREKLGTTGVGIDLSCNAWQWI
jgi:hypothetical protein